MRLIGVFGLGMVVMLSLAWISAPQQAPVGTFQVASAGQDLWVVVHTTTGVSCRISPAKQDGFTPEMMETWDELFIDQGYTEEQASRLAVERSFSDCFIFPEYSVPVFRDPAE